MKNQTRIFFIFCFLVAYLISFNAYASPQKNHTLIDLIKNINLDGYTNLDPKTVAYKIFEQPFKEKDSTVIRILIPSTDKDAIYKSYFEPDSFLVFILLDNNSYISQDNFKKKIKNIERYNRHRVIPDFQRKDIIEKFSPSLDNTQTHPTLIEFIRIDNNTYSHLELISSINSLKTTSLFYFNGKIIEINIYKKIDGVNSYLSIKENTNKVINNLATNTSLGAPPAKNSTFKKIFLILLSFSIILTPIILLFYMDKKLHNKNFNSKAKKLFELTKKRYSEEYIKPKPWLRFWARVLDYNIFSVMLVFILSYTSISMEIASYIALSLFSVFLWIFVEAAFISLYKTTPGKALLNIHVSDIQNKKLSYTSALKRSFLVWFRGMGMGIPFIWLLTCISGYSALTTKGTTSWDFDTRSIVFHKKIGFIRLVLSIIVSILVIISILYPSDTHHL